jgi:hypothetical protein
MPSIKSVIKQKKAVKDLVFLVAVVSEEGEERPGG